MNTNDPYGIPHGSQFEDDNKSDNSGFGTAYHDGSGFDDCDPKNTGYRTCDKSSKHACSECIYLASFSKQSISTIKED